MNPDPASSPSQPVQHPKSVPSKASGGPSKESTAPVSTTPAGVAPAPNASRAAPALPANPTPYDIRGPITIGEEPLRIQTEPWNQERERDQTRSIVAGALIALLIAIVLLPFVLLAIKAIDIAALDTLLKIVFAPVVGLVGSVIGFYFGSQSTRKEPGGGGN